MWTFVAALGLTLAGCSSDDVVLGDFTTPGNGGAQDGEAIEFASRIVGDLEILEEDGEAQAITRSMIENGEFTSWTNGDDVSISDGTLHYAYEVTGVPAGGSKYCKFAVVEGGNAFPTNDANKQFYAFYPEAAVKAWNGSTVTTQIYSEQLYSENINGGLFGAYMAAAPSTVVDGKVTFNFNLVASVIDVNLANLALPSGVNVESVSLMSNINADGKTAGPSIAGKLKYNCDEAKGAVLVDNDATDYAASTKSDVITVSGVEAGATLVRFYVLPVRLDRGVTITVKTTDGKYYTKSASTSVGTATSDANITGAGTTCYPYYKKYNFGAASTATKVNNWMATLPSNTKFHMLSIPGAHNAGTENIGLSASVCQSKNFEGLLECGVRAFDIRPGYCANSEFTPSTLKLAHGMTSTSYTFVAAMDYLVNFVKANPTEVVVVTMQKEDNNNVIGSLKDQSASWRTVVRNYLTGASYDGAAITDRANYLLSAVTANMTLADCRGKVVVLSRTPYGNENVYNDVVVGARLFNWPDDAVSSSVEMRHVWDGWIASAYAQDCYTTTNYSTREGQVKEALTKAAEDKGTAWYFNALNIHNSPKSHAGNMNPRVNTLLTNGSYDGRTGIIFYDFCGDSSTGGDALNKSIINQNAEYLFHNRSRNLPASNNTGVEVNGDEYADDSEIYVKPQI